MQWSKDKSFEWYKNNEWIVGCNYLPSNAINQLEMFQSDTYDAEMNLRELTWAKELGFNSVRVYLHDLLWEDSINFKRNLNSFCWLRPGPGLFTKDNSGNIDLSELKSMIEALGGKVSEEDSHKR